MNIYLFGSVRVLQFNRELSMRPASQMLLLYLLLHRAKYIRREELSAIFWSDANEVRARRCLNTALWRLRQDIVDNGIIGSNFQGDLILNLKDNHYLDIDEFETTAQLGFEKTPESLDLTEVTSLEKAVNIYQGDLAENCFYDWVLPERERLRNLYLDTLTILMRTYSHNQDYPHAIYTGQKILECDPLREDVHRQMMRLFIAIDQRSRALQQYMTCWQILHDELHTTPMLETTALYEQIMGQEPFAELSAIPSSSASPPMPNLERLINLLHHLQSETQHVLHDLQKFNRKL